MHGKNKSSRGGGRNCARRQPRGGGRPASALSAPKLGRIGTRAESTVNMGGVEKGPCRDKKKDVTRRRTAQTATLRARSGARDPRLLNTPPRGNSCARSGGAPPPIAAGKAQARTTRVNGPPRRNGCSQRQFTRTPHTRLHSSPEVKRGASSPSATVTTSSKRCPIRDARAAACSRCRPEASTEPVGQ